jgi:hypothetical protein
MLSSAGASVGSSDNGSLSRQLSSELRAGCLSLLWADVWVVIVVLRV